MPKKTEKTNEIRQNRVAVLFTPTEGEALRQHARQLGAKERRNVTVSSLLREWALEKLGLDS